MFFAALAQVHVGLEPHDGDGFVIITAASDQGMVDIHDRRPLVFAPEHSRDWVGGDLDRERAEELALGGRQATEAFEWFLVRKEVGNVRNE